MLSDAADLELFCRAVASSLCVIHYGTPSVVMQRVSGWIETQLL